MKRELKEVSCDELEGVSGGFDACGLANLPALNRQQGLRAADYAFQHAKANGWNAQQFNRVGWRAYSERACLGGSRAVDRRDSRTFRDAEPRGLGDLRM